MRHARSRSVATYTLAALLLALLSVTATTSLVASNSLDEVAMSRPAIARGSLFIRTRSHLWRLTDASPSAEARPSGH